LDFECRRLRVAIGIKEGTSLRSTEPGSVITCIPVDELIAVGGIETGLY